MEPIDELDKRIFTQWDIYVTQHACVPSRLRKWLLVALATFTVLLLSSGVLALRA